MMRLTLPTYLLLFTIGCIGQVDATSVDFDSQSITIAFSEEPPQLNSMKATDSVSIDVLSHTMEGLARYDRRGQMVPGVAERWEIDDKSATFWLNKNARWSDGKPVTAKDFIYAWQTALDPATASEYSFILYSLKNAEAINKGELPPSVLAVQAPDDHTLVIELERPTAYFIKLTAFASYFPIREDFYKKKGERYAADASDLLYNGAFMMTEWVHSASLKLVKNPHYWNKDSITLNAINVDYITADSRSQLNLFIDGKIAHTQLDGDTYKDALSQKFRIRRFTTGVIYFQEYNHRPGRITANRNIRKAIQHVFDPHEMVNRVLATPGNLPGESLFPVWLNGVNGKFRQEYPAPRAKIDVNLAREHLDRAKIELGLEKIPPLVLLVGESPTATKNAEYMQGLLMSKLGLDIRIDKQTFKQRLAKMSSGDFDMVGAGWGPDYDDVMTFGDLYASWNLNNRGRYINPEYDRLVRVAMNSSNPQVRMDAMGEMQQILFDDATLLPTSEQGVIYLIHPKLKGVTRRVIGADPDYTYARVVK